MQGTRSFRCTRMQLGEVYQARGTFMGCELKSSSLLPIIVGEHGDLCWAPSSPNMVGKLITSGWQDRKFSSAFKLPDATRYTMEIVGCFFLYFLVVQDWTEPNYHNTKLLSAIKSWINKMVNTICLHCLCRVMFVCILKHAGFYDAFNSLLRDISFASMLGVRMFYFIFFCKCKNEINQMLFY
jgi:hypothetical protein